MVGVRRGGIAYFQIDRKPWSADRALSLDDGRVITGEHFSQLATHLDQGALNIEHIEVIDSVLFSQAVVRFD